MGWEWGGNEVGMAGMRRECVGNASEFGWECIGNASGMHRECVGNGMGMGLDFGWTA